MNKNYYYRYGPLCELGSPTSTGDCRYNSPFGGFGNSQCTPSGLDGYLRLVGYAVDGFRIYASDEALPDSYVDNCGGRFFESPFTGLYTYAYVITASSDTPVFPYVLGCFGPGTFWRNGSQIDYTHIRDFIDTTCML